MSLGGSSTTTVEQQLPQYMEDASKQAIKASQQAAAIGYVPYMGPDVAAMTPMQMAAFDSTNAAASAYGLPTAATTGLPEATTYANGMQGYSSFPMYQQAITDFAKMYPGQYEQIMSMFVNPQTGKQPTYTTQPASSSLLYPVK
jgi:hypothetical protein